MFIMTKIISVSDDAYDALKVLKGEKDSFTDVITRLSKSRKTKSIMDFAGMWKESKEMDKIFSAISKDRKNIKLREVKF